MNAGGPLVAVLDYGIGNLRSAEKALCRVGADARLTDDRGLIGDARAVVLPGVGAFGACMAALRARRLDDPALDAVASGRPFLGICIGMQMMFETSDEDADAKGLGVIAGTVEWIPGDVKRPQMQWNRLDLARPDDADFDGVGPAPWMYFVHSLHGVPADAAVISATCDYGGPVTAVVRQQNVLACQFHPEKSGRNGLAFLRRFVSSLPDAG
jgi:imidazole glycerol-phosphate synthase subunit HisH